MVQQIAVDQVKAFFFVSPEGRQVRFSHDFQSGDILVRGVGLKPNFDDNDQPSHSENFPNMEAAKAAEKEWTERCEEHGDYRSYCQHEP